MRLNCLIVANNHAFSKATQVRAHEQLPLPNKKTTLSGIKIISNFLLSPLDYTLLAFIFQLLLYFFAVLTINRSLL